MLFALKKESVPTERRSKSLTTTPEKTPRKFSLSKTFSDSQPLHEETSPLPTNQKSFFLHLNNICSAQTKVLVKEPTTPRFSLHTKDKSTTEEKEACLDQNARQISTKQQQATMSEDIMESFAPTWEDIKYSSENELSTSKDAKEFSSKDLSEETENSLSRNELDTVFQLLEENYEMATTELQTTELTNTQEYMRVLSEVILRMENAFQTINTLLEYTENQLYSTEISNLL
ncbi:hypothetical protein GAYE_SCF12G3358 [Galdieria yellowstonensis]|uniref:Uncharacterized protein n=1 Tax=Galdieria yellowstonensis TaxID=3028027 RepID=A0AAV9ID98_9RHOD|nr:hypothetical protein GAYE_SCF12G3358 [Galdieria yellowstonensis]